MSRKAVACIPASTTNLGPGFDVLGLALKLYSTISLEEIDSDVRVVVHGVDRDKISASVDNIALNLQTIYFRKPVINQRVSS